MRGRIIRCKSGMNGNKVEEKKHGRKEARKERQRGGWKKGTIEVTLER